MTMDAKQAGNRLYLVGSTGADFGGSELHAYLGLDGGRVPCPDLATAPHLFQAVHSTLAKGLVRACHDLSEGGLAVALAETCLAGRLGASIDLAQLPLDELPEGYHPDTSALFSESCSRFLIEVSPDNAASFEAALEDHVYAHIGDVSNDGHLCVRGAGGSDLINLSVEDLAHAFTGTHDSSAAPAQRVAPEGS
jgi:phosphoribosylformylglycinamidine (FGAM) synthase-like enzyme